MGSIYQKKKSSESFEKFDLNARNATNAANAIRTTDRFTKEIALQVDLENGKSFKIAGFAKGAGMIEPNMATMLCYIITDTTIPQGDMRELLQSCVKTTFNAISVDGDTSTNDSVFLNEH